MRREFISQLTRDYLEVTSQANPPERKTQLIIC
jgi:hypothetical protein